MPPTSLAHRAFVIKEAPLGQRLNSVRVSVVGLGKSGLSAIDVSLAEGAQVTAFDEKPLASALASRNVRLLTGPFTDELWKAADVVVVSPGVPLAHETLQRAMQAGVPVVGEVEWGMALLPLGHGPVVGITGTNGKSTTTALTGELFSRHFQKVFVGGNLGRPFSEATRQAYDAFVVELSSFQLEGLVEASFHGAAWLNLTPDHGDRYASMSAYAAAKARIFARQKASDFAVVNAEDVQVMEAAKAARGPVYGFTSTGKVASNGPTLAGLAQATKDGFVFDFGEKPSFQVQSRALRGGHNLENAMAAALLAHLSGIGQGVIQEGLSAFGGLPHRLESVRVLNGVEWINDSKATNVDSSVMALRALSGPLWLIAGGKGKGASYAPIVEAAVGKVKGVLTVGSDAEAISAAFQSLCPVHSCGTVENAVKRAQELAISGEMVLLSPACASYDQFLNFEDRGDRFKAWVRAL